MCISVDIKILTVFENHLAWSSLKCIIRIPLLVKIQGGQDVSVLFSARVPGRNSIVVREG